jgi:hypothetical protein
MRDNTGAVVYPARVKREWTDNATPGSSAPGSWLAVAAGTYGTPSGWSGTSQGRATLTSGAVSGNAAAIKAAAPLNVINTANFNALVLTIESLNIDADTGADYEMGFQGIGSLGGASLMHLNGATTAVVRVRDGSGTITDFPTNYTIFQGSGGGRSRRNVTFALLPRGYVGDNRAFAYILEDDQTMAEVDISSVYTTGQNVVPIFQTITRTAAARIMSWANVRMQIWHN